MDDHFVALSTDEDDNFEEVGSEVGSYDQPPVRVLADVVDQEGVFNGVEDVLISDAVSASRRVNLHTALSYYETRGCSGASLKTVPPRRQCRLEDSAA